MSCLKLGARTRLGRQIQIPEEHLNANEDDIKRSPRTLIFGRQRRLPIRTIIIIIVLVLWKKLQREDDLMEEVHVEKNEGW